MKLKTMRTIAWTPFILAYAGIIVYFFVVTKLTFSSWLLILIALIVVVWFFIWDILADKKLKEIEK